MDSSIFNPFHDLCRVAPSHMLALIAHAGEKQENPEYALAALENAHEHLRDGLDPFDGRIPASLLSKFRGLAGVCAFGGPTFIDRLGKIFPEIWSEESIVDDVFRNLVDGLCCQWECEDDFNQPLAARFSQAAAMAASWIGSGLAPRPWAILAEAGGPLFHAFSAEHAESAKADPARLPGKREILEMSPKAFARLRKSLGARGYGEWGSWANTLGGNYGNNHWLAIQTGFKCLFDEIAQAQSGNGNAFELAQRLGQALANGTFSADIHPKMKPLIISCAKRSFSAGISLETLSVDVPVGLGFPQGHRYQIATDIKVPLSVIFILSTHEDIRELGFLLGATADLASSTWGEAMRSGRGRGASTDELMALLEGRILAAVSDEAQYLQGSKQRKSISSQRL